MVFSARATTAEFAQVGARATAAELVDLLRPPLIAQVAAVPLFFLLISRFGEAPLEGVMSELLMFCQN